MRHVIIIITGAVSLFTENTKKKKLENNVHFYVARDKNGDLYLYLSEPVRSGSYFYPDFCGRLIASEPNFKNFDLKVEDFKNIKLDEGQLRCSYT